MTVWMDDWQLQCCGDPFAIGSEVSWTVEPTTGDGWHQYLAALLGADPGFTVDAIEDHHDQLPAGTGRYPVDGSGTLIDVRSADGSDESEGGRRFMGYLVQLDA